MSAAFCLERTKCSIVLSRQSRLIDINITGRLFTVNQCSSSSNLKREVKAFLETSCDLIKGMSKPPLFD